MMLQQKTILLSLIRRSAVNEQRTNSFFANPRFHSKAPIQSLRQSLQRQLSNQIFFVFRPISNNGFRTTDIPRKPERCRNLFTSFRRKTLSLWFSWQSFSQQFSQRQRKKRLANISRLCTSTNQKSQTTLCGRRLRHHIKKYRLCFGRNRDRSMSVFVSMGPASQTQKCRKATHANGSKGLYTHVYTHYERCHTRNNSLSNFAFGAISHICHGQRLHRLYNIIQFFKEQFLFCCKSKKEYRLLPPMFSFSRQKHWFTKRPNNKIDWPKNFKTLPDTTEANQFSRRRSTAYFCVPDQQFSVGCVDNLPALQTTLADRTFLQVDQTALANKVFFRYFDQCCQDPGLDRDQCLCACSDNQKRAEVGAFATRNTPNSKYFSRKPR